MPQPAGAKRTPAERQQILQKLAPLQELAWLPGTIEIDLQARNENKNLKSIPIQGRASGPKLNSHGFAIDPAAWTKPRAFGRFDKNPVMLFDHDQRDIAGIVVERTPDEIGLKFKGNVIAPDERRRLLIEEGAMRAVSVGVAIYDAELRPIGPNGESIPVVTDIELREVTLAAVPSDEDALFQVNLTIGKSMAEALNEELAAPSAPAPKGEDMNTKEIAKALGLPETATLAECIAKAGAVTMQATQLQAVAQAAGLEAGAPAPAIIAKLSAELVQTNRQLAGENLFLTHQAKIPATQHAFAKGLAIADPARFNEYVASLAATPGATVPTPETHRISDLARPGAAAGAATEALAGSAEEGVKPTAEDRRVTEAFGAFKTAEDMLVLSNTKPWECLRWIFPATAFGPTARDKAAVANREF